MSEAQPIPSVNSQVERIKTVWSHLRRFLHASMIWLPLGIIVFLLLTLFFVISKIGQQQDIRKKAATAGVQLSLIPSQITASANMEYTVAITINTGEEMVSAADIRLSFDPTKLEVQSVSPGDFLPVVLVQGKVANGTASITLGSQPTEPKKGSGVLASLKIKSLGQTTAINFSNATQVAAIGKSGNVVEKLIGSIVTVSSETPTPTPTLTPSTPTPMPTARFASPTPTPTPTVELSACISCVAPPQGCEYIGSKFCGVPAEVTCGKLVCSTSTPKPTSIPTSGTDGFSSLLQTPTSIPSRLCKPKCVRGYRPDYTSCSCLPEGISTPTSTPMLPPIFVPPTELPPISIIEPSREPSTKTGDIIIDFLFSFLEVFCKLLLFCK